MASSRRAIPTRRKPPPRGSARVFSLSWLRRFCVRSSSKRPAMAEYPVNKGIGRSVEFKGLKAQYLFIFCGGLLALFVLFVILYMIGIDQWFCIGFGVVSASVLVWQTFALNARYGEHGLMKLGAARSPTRYILNRRKISRLFNRKKQKNEKYT